MNQNASPTPTQPIAPAQTSLLRRIFAGGDGLRAGWSLLIFLALCAASLWAASFFAGKIFPHAPGAAEATSERLVRGAFIKVVLLVAIFLVTWIMSKIERRPNSVYGLGGRRKVARFFAGLVWGVVCLSLLVVTLWKTGFLAIDSRLLFGSDILRYGATWLLVFLLVALFEEYLMRGYIQFTLARGLAGLYRWAFETRLSMTRNGEAFGFWTSAVLLSILFSLGHSNNPGESPIGLLSNGLVAMVFCLSLWRTGALWWAIGFHAAWDWSESFLYGVADSGLMFPQHLLASHPVGKPILSGGATGPEGSIFIVAIEALICLIILFTLSRDRQVDTTGVEMPEQST